MGRAEATPRQVAANVETATTATPPIRTLFMLEAAVNAVSGPLMIIAPRLVLMAEEEHIVSDEAAELGRWFGCMVFAFGAVLLGRALRAGRSCSNCSLEMYATRHAPIFGWGGFLDGAAVFNIGFSVVLLVARVAAIRDIRVALPRICTGREVDAAAGEKEDE